MPAIGASTTGVATCSEPRESPVMGPFSAVTGVVEHGLFVAMASAVVVGAANASVRVLTR